jgi:hypothetical protein
MALLFQEPAPWPSPPINRANRPPRTQEHSWTHFAAPLMSPPAPYQERSHRCGSQGHWPLTRHLNPSQQPSSPKPRPSYPLPAAQHRIWWAAQPNNQEPPAPPPAPAHVAASPCCPLSRHKPGFCCSLLLVGCIGAGRVAPLLARALADTHGPRTKRRRRSSLGGGRLIRRAR